MDKKIAALTLTEKLREDNNTHIIINPVYQKKLIKESLACYQVGDIIAFGPYSIRDSLKNKNSAMYEKLEPKANYLFIESFEIDKRAIASSFAIIGKEEINQLRNTFYKNVPSDIEVALKILDIKNYAEIYEKYSNGGLNKLLSENYGLYLKLKKSLDDLFSTEDSYCAMPSFEKYLRMDKKDLINRFKENGLGSNIHVLEGSGIHKTAAINIIEKLKTIKYFDLLPGFFDLAFAIPREEQNIEANKTILKLSCETLDSTKILMDEYFKGKNFQEYFECLDDEKQKKVISALEFKKADNSVYNSFLWSKGFRTVGLDHLRLYKDDAKGFIEYFNSKNAEEKKAILKDVMGCDTTNETVVNWLNLNHLDLIREVGLNG